MNFKKNLILGTGLTLFSISPALADVIEDSFNFNNTEISGANAPATSDDAGALVINPGGIGIKSEGELFFSNSITGSQQTNLLATFGNINLGYQQFNPLGKKLKPLRKYIVGTGYPIFRGFNLGLTYHNIQSTDGSNIGTSSIDLGLISRPVDFLSAGIVVRNLNTPFFDQSQINRVYAGSLGFRPGGNDRFTITIDAEWVEGSPAEKIRGRLGLETEFIDGINLRGKVYADPKLEQLAWSVDLGLNFPYIGAGYFRMQDTKSENVRDAVYAKVSLNHGRSLFQKENVRMAEIKFNGLVKPIKNVSKGLFVIEQKDSVYDYLQEIENAEKDKDIAGIVLNLENFQIGLGAAEEIRNKLYLFKKSGKKIVAYLHSPEIKHYYLASIADHVVMHPIGEINFSGLAITNYYFRDLLDRVGIEAQFEKFGKYKSATEIYTEKTASAEDEQQTKKMLEDFYESLIRPIAERRKIDPQKLKEIVDQKSLLSAVDARDLRLVDEIAYFDQIGKISANLAELKGEFPLIDLSRREYRKYKWRENNKIAIINAGGVITEGKSTTDFFSGETTMGAETICKMLKEAREDEEIKAIVFRIDSGGGSAMASDLIARELQLFREEGKPIVISMANISASGGYWLSAQADKIIANEKTLTGSIGVFTGKVNFAGLLEKLGINNKTFKIGEHADYLSQSRAFSPEERKIVNESAATIYRIFLEKVSSGRKLQISEVEKLAQGKVYSGIKAKEIKLIDEIGGLEKAVEIAAELAKIKEAKIINLEFENDLMAKLTEEPTKAFYPLIMMRLFGENKVLAIMPNMIK